MTSLIADKTRAGLMGPNHVRRLARVESIVKDPLAFTDVEPTLDLDFTNIKGAPFTGNLVRATVGGYRMNNKGVMVPTVANEPVIDFDTAGKPIGTGFYGAYTNLLLRSEEFENASWFKTGTTVTANAVAGPDGATTVDKLVEDTSTGNHIAIQSVSLTNGTTFTASVILKAAERTFVRVRIGDSGFVGDAVVDLSAGTITSGNGTSSIVNLGNGFYRVSVTGVVVAGNIASVQITLRQSLSVESYTGDGTSGLYVWGAQLTATAFPVPYVPTTSATVARNADSMIISGSDFTDFFNPVEGTFYLDFVAPRFLSSGVSNLMSVSGATSNEIIGLRINNVAQYLEATAFVGGVTTGLIQSPVLITGQMYRVAYSYKLNQFRISLNGGSTSEDLSSAVPTVDRLGIGSASWSPGAAGANTNFKRLIYWPKALSAAELQRMTA